MFPAINPPNLGDDATYSGTVAGALEATILGVPGLAFSLVVGRNHDFTQSAKSAREIVEKALAEGLPEGTLLNVNIPKGVPKGIRITKQGFKTARPVISEHTDPRGKAYYWIGEIREGFRAEGGTDFEAIDEGMFGNAMRSDLTITARSRRFGQNGRAESISGERVRQHEDGYDIPRADGRKTSRHYKSPGRASSGLNERVAAPSFCQRGACFSSL